MADSPEPARRTSGKGIARTALRVVGRGALLALRVVSAIFGAMEGRGNAAGPPPLPPGRREDYRP